MNPYRKILVAVDGSKAANRGLREAIRLAKGGDAALVIVQATAARHEVKARTDLHELVTAGAAAWCSAATLSSSALTAAALLERSGACWSASHVKPPLT